VLDDQTMDRVLQALSDTTRRRLVERLSDGPAGVTELARPFDVTLSAVMQHLTVLERSGIVTSSKTGRVRTYQLVPGALQPVERWAHRQRTAWESRLDALATVLTDQSNPRPPAPGETP